MHPCSIMDFLLLKTSIVAVLVETGNSRFLFVHGTSACSKRRCIWNLSGIQKFPFRKKPLSGCSTMCTEGRKRPCDCSIHPRAVCLPVDADMREGPVPSPSAGKGEARPVSLESHRTRSGIAELCMAKECPLYIGLDGSEMLSMQAWPAARPLMGQWRHRLLGVPGMCSSPQ